jgi:hypothetical protein
MRKLLLSVVQCGETITGCEKTNPNPCLTSARNANPSVKNGTNETVVINQIALEFLLASRGPAWLVSTCVHGAVVAVAVDACDRLALLGLTILASLCSLLHPWRGCGVVFLPSMSQLV